TRASGLHQIDRADSRVNWGLFVNPIDAIYSKSSRSKTRRSTAVAADRSLSASSDVRGISAARSPWSSDALPCAETARPLPDPPPLRERGSAGLAQAPGVPSPARGSAS